MVTIERFAFAGDWHMNGRWGVRAIHHAADLGAQGIVHCGDFGYQFEQNFLDQVSAALRARGMRLWFADGNHENFTKLSRWDLAEDGTRPLTDRISHLPRGYRWQWGGVRFLALGGAYSVDQHARIPGREWWPQETITDQQALRAVAAGRTDVLVTHDAPSSVVIPGIDDREKVPAWIPPGALRESLRHRQVLDRVVDGTTPAWIWHGHYHVRHTTAARYRFGATVVNGLDCDGSVLDDNVVVVDVSELAPAAVAG